MICECIECTDITCTDCDACEIFYMDMWIAHKREFETSCEECHEIPCICDFQEEKI